jgi:hypothetical protein
MIGVVDRRGDEIGGHHQGQFGADFIDSGIIAGVVADQQIVVFGLGEAVQQFSEPDRVDFCRSAAGLGKTLQGRFPEKIEDGHGVLFSFIVVFI